MREMIAGSKSVLIMLNLEDMSGNVSWMVVTCSAIPGSTSTTVWTFRAESLTTRSSSPAVV